ncbi:unnamed protein product [Ilex paraguariensis]|uniref:Uncharacterized protein n=1 Tax=Ilex paraguariensis TaxID=185542 RepID=A0ABC8R4Z1_9AQUA
MTQVQERFEVLKKRKDTGGFTEQDFDERILRQQQEEEERKRQRRERKKEKVSAREGFLFYLQAVQIRSSSPYGRRKKLDGMHKEKAAEEEIEVDPDVAAMMGFGGFGSSKK